MAYVLGLECPKLDHRLTRLTPQPDNISILLIAYLHIIWKLLIIWLLSLTNMGGFS